MSKQIANQPHVRVGRIINFASAKTKIVHEGKVTSIVTKRTGEWITVKHGDGSTSTFRRSQVV
jgi:hypothetical protein